MRELIEKTLAVNEFDFKKNVLAAAATLALAAGPAIKSYQKAPEVEPTPSLTKVSAPAEVSKEWETVRMEVTAYCADEACTGTESPGITASGHEIKAGDVFVAADKSVPFGTEMKIPGYNDGQPVEVLDRGGAIKGNRIDVFMSTHEAALEWGRQTLDVEVMR